MKPQDKVILEKINKYAKQAFTFVGKMNLQEFTKDEKTVSACVFNLSQIGEIVARLSPEFTNANPNIPWQKIKGLRNRIVHDYDGIQLNIIWDVLKEFLPSLIKDIGELM